MRAALVLALVACGPSYRTGPRISTPPRGPVEMIVAAFKNHDVVALDEGGHGNVAVHDFIATLLPALDGVDVVVEFGSARYQDLADRYVAGEDVPDLRNVWQQTTQVLVWESPVYAQFFRTVRELNRARPPARRLRVVLADPPIDWATVTTWQDWARTNRDEHAAAVVEREVLARGHKALLIFGAMHLARHDIQVNYEPSGMLVERLVTAGRRVLTVYASPLPPAVEGDITARAPELLLLANSRLGRHDFASVLGDAAPQRRFDPKAGRPLDPAAHATRSFADIFDAVLFVGPAASIKYAEPSPAVLADDAYYQELVRRSHVLHDIALEDIEALRARAVR